MKFETKYYLYLALFFAFITFVSDLYALLLMRKVAELQANPLLLVIEKQKIQQINVTLAKLQEASLIGTIGFIANYGYYYYSVRVKTDSL